jgi:hypothetical protein
LAEIACGNFSGLTHHSALAAGERRGFRPHRKPQTHFLTTPIKRRAKSVVFARESSR